MILLQVSSQYKFEWNINEYTVPEDDDAFQIHKANPNPGPDS